MNKNILEDKECEWCGDCFTPKQAASRFCYKQHYNKCKYCSDPILIKQMKRIPTYCSQSCGSKDRSYVLKCQLCDSDFSSKKKSAKICSNDHYEECVSCGDKFIIINPHKPAKSCSKVCASKLVDFNKRNAKSLETFSSTYGEKIINASQLDFVKEKKAKTTLKNYGVTNPSLSEKVKEKRKQTNLERYGVENGGGAPETQSRIRETNLMKYGVKNVFEAEVVKEKILETLQVRYGKGIINPLQVDSIKAKARATTLERFGVKSVLALPSVQALSASKSNRISKVNRDWKRRLDSFVGVDFKLERLFADSMYADLSFDEVFVDINPTVTHNSTTSFSCLIHSCEIGVCTSDSHIAKDSMSHHNRFISAEKSGVTLLQYFDWCNKQVFANIVKSKIVGLENNINANECVIKEISKETADLFLKENHLIGTSSSHTLFIGLYYDEILVYVSTFYKPVMSSDDWEVSRFSSKINWTVKSGLSICSNFIHDKFKAKTITVSLDLSVNSLLEDSIESNWRLVSTNKPSAMWCFVGSLEKLGDRPRFVRYLTAQRISADRLLGFEVGEKYPTHHLDGGKFTNSDVLISEGYVKVFDAGTRTFVWGSSD